MLHHIKVTKRQIRVSITASSASEQEDLDRLEDLEDRRPFSAWWELSLDEDQRRNRQLQDRKQKVDASL